MSERIAEAELEGLASDYNVGALVAEVRRLRGLIAACEVQDGGFLPRDFEAEAQAIREEQT
jgi:hypothetical protein